MREGLRGDEVRAVRQGGPRLEGLPMKAIAVLVLAATAHAELRVPAFTAYIDPNPNALHVSSKDGIIGWKDPSQRVQWFGEIKTVGKLDCALVLRLPKNATSKLRLSVGAQSRDATATGATEMLTVKFGEFAIAKPGYARFTLESLNAAGQPAGDLDALVLDGPAAADAHFNLEPRRNAASVHLSYPAPRDTNVAVFYNEMTGV